jgi:outer membrane protein assembly factor BamB
MRMNLAVLTSKPSGQTIKAFVGIAVFVALGLLSACSITSEKVKFSELPAIDSKISAKLAWSVRVGTVNTPLEIAVDSASSSSSTAVTAASSDGVVASFDVMTGRVLWRAQAGKGKSLSSGAGVDGDLAAVVTEANELVAFNKGVVAWRQKLAGASFTAPLLKNGKVYVLGSDRSMSAYDGTNGAKL